MKYYLIWIEGLTYRSGEKIKTLTQDGHTYTNLMTEALRFTNDNLKEACDLLMDKGVSEWAITPIQTNYAPKGTVWKDKLISLKA
jgi:hypothetical protein